MEARLQAMQLHFSLSMGKTLYKEKRKNDQSKHEINLTKIKGYFRLQAT